MNDDIVNELASALRALIKAHRFQTRLALAAGGPLYINDGTHDDNTRNSIPSNADAFMMATRALDKLD